MKPDICNALVRIEYAFHEMETLPPNEVARLAEYAKKEALSCNLFEIAAAAASIENAARMSQISFQRSMRLLSEALFLTTAYEQAA